MLLSPFGYTGFNAPRYRLRAIRPWRELSSGSRAHQIVPQATAFRFPLHGRLLK